MIHVSPSPLSHFLAATPPIALAVPPIDAAVIVIYLLATIAIGMWVGRGQKNLNDYLLGDRNLPWLAVLGSIVATETSTATFLSVPGEAFKEGGDLRFLQLTFGYIIGRFAVGWLLLPQYFRGELYTSYQVLHQRFGGAMKSTASVLFLLTRNLGDGLRLYLAALALAAFLDVEISTAIWIIGPATIVYTVFGGMRSVVWNDCVQLVVYVAGGAVMLVLILARLPEGFSGFLEFGRNTGRFQVLDFSWTFSDPYVFWAGLVGGAFLTLGTHGTDQMTVQRLLSARGERDARKALVASGFVVLGQFALFLLVGVALAAYFNVFPTETSISAGDEAVSTFIADEMPVGVRGVLLAAVFAAAMSTLSSSLNSSASSAVNDLLMSLMGKSTPGRLLRLGRGLTIVFGILQIGVALVAQPVINALGQSEDNSVVGTVLAIASFTTGIILGVFFLGVLTRRVGQNAALLGLAAGVAVTIGTLVLGARGRFDLVGLPSDFQLAWPWYACVGSVVTFLVGNAASLILPRPERRFP